MLPSPLNHRLESAKFAVTIDVLLSLTQAFGIPLKELVDCPEMEQANVVAGLPE